jgi:hypothetical protein
MSIQFEIKCRWVGFFSNVSKETNQVNTYQSFIFLNSNGQSKKKYDDIKKDNNKQIIIKQDQN